MSRLLLDLLVIHPQCFLFPGWGKNNIHSCVTGKNFFGLISGVTFTGPLKVEIFLCQHLQRHLDVLLDVVYHPLKISNLLCVSGPSKFFDYIDLFWIWCNSLSLPFSLNGYRTNPKAHLFCHVFHNKYFSYSASTSVTK